MFISTSDGSFINSADVTRIAHSKVKDAYGRYTVYAVLRDGPPVDLLGSMDDVLRSLTVMIPASAGFEVLQTWWDDEDNVLRVQRHPVLGWREDPSGGLLPVILDSDEVYSNVSFGAVKYPDGQVVCVADAVYENEAKWLADKQRQELKRQAVSQAPRAPAKSP